jgi:hypothetical protein
LKLKNGVKSSPDAKMFGMKKLSDVFHGDLSMSSMASQQK